MGILARTAAAHRGPEVQATAWISRGRKSCLTTCWFERSVSTTTLGVSYIAYSRAATARLIMLAITARRRTMEGLLHYAGSSPIASISRPELWLRLNTWMG